jgi:hypothetical protein
MASGKFAVPASLAEIAGLVLRFSLLTRMQPPMLRIPLVQGRTPVPEIPENVRQFVAKHIHSIDVLEILLLIRKEALKEWEANTISGELSLDRDAVEARLQQLESAGLLVSQRTADGTKYRYDPSTPELAAAVNEFAHWYWSYPVAMIGLVYSSRA